MVKIYTAPNCPYCRKVKTYLDMNSINYEDINVVQNKEEREEMIKLSGQQSVPVVNINGKIILGFNKFAIDSALAEINK